ncbi:C-type lectin domain family 10 member A-like isoform X2 [Pristis pectinata]|uniref:C-type lectin domain family 10 member A-like isoform X2 n=1 Tax=Pristis pectinata TaxID=685728 RepID=UPI00223E49EE|nr:C-type lectin domain family 10 member A-like isoform X2 [Pristis pectinata]
MESVDTYQNVQDILLHQQREDRVQSETLKPDHRVPPAVSVRVRLWPWIICSFLGCFILLSAGAFRIAVILRTETADADFRKELSQWKSNVTQMMSEITAGSAGLQIEFLQWKSKVAGYSDNTLISIAELQAETSRLSNMTKVVSETKAEVAGLRMELLHLQSNVTQMVSEIKEEAAGLWMQLSQCNSNVTQMVSEGQVEAVGLLSQWKSNVTQMLSDGRAEAAGLHMELSKLKSNVTGNSEKTLNSIAKFQAEISRLSKNPRPCPEQWTRFKKNCYQFSSRTKTWVDAQKSCASEDAHLVVINNVEEQGFLRKQIQNQYHWIGLSDSVSEGDWRWVDGTDYVSSVKFWRNGEPNNLKNEDCGQMLRDGNWNDMPCQESHQWICEKPGE